MNERSSNAGGLKLSFESGSGATSIKLEAYLFTGLQSYYTLTMPILGGGATFCSSSTFSSPGMMYLFLIGSHLMPSPDRPLKHSFLAFLRLKTFRTAPINLENLEDSTGGSLTGGCCFYSSFFSSSSSLIPPNIHGK